jgi:hypothetical protein
MKKKLFFTLFLTFTLFLPLSAQVRMGNFTQSGQASQEMTDSGLVAAHPSLPLKTSVKVKNTANNKEVDVTITNRVGVSSSRIIDLSAAAYKALDLKKGDIVSISVNAPPASAPIPKVAAAVEPSPPPPAPAAAVEPAPAAPVQTAAAPPPAGAVVTSGQLPGINVVITNSTPIYSGSTGKEPAQEKIIVINPNPPASSSSNAAYLAWMMAMTMDAREARASREDREIREAREAREARAARLAREEREEKEYREAREARLARETRETNYYRGERETEEVRLTAEEQEYGYLETRELWY